ADVHFHAPAGYVLLNDLPDVAFPNGVLLGKRELEVEKALVDAFHLDRDRASRAGAEPDGRGPESRHALHAGAVLRSSATSSAADAVAVPSLRMTTPAARLASTAASSKVAPAASASAAVASTVSPAPVTS